VRILKKYNLEDFLFIDIETAPSVPELVIDTPLYDAWSYYCIKNDIEDVVGSYFTEAPLYAEFGRIACITIGAVRNDKIVLKTFSNEDEKELLEEFNQAVSKFANNKTWLCGHVITGFDAPFIMKRCLINRVEMHQIFDMAHEKPWTVPYFDTALLWKSTGFKVSTLVSVTTALGLPSPKEEFNGSDVGRLYYEGKIKDIVKYCERDVVAVVNVVRVLRGEEPIEVSEPVEQEPLGILEYIFLGGEYTAEIAEQLKTAISKMTKTDKAKAIEILNVLPCKAKGKETSITKKDIKELING
jgi:hypothetical protein